MRSNNPVLSRPEAFAPQYDQFQQPTDRMTFDDVLTKTAITMGLLVVTAAVAWWLIPPTLYWPVFIVSAIVGLVTVAAVCLRGHVSPAIALAYAGVEGLFIGMFSRMFESFYDGIVTQAIIATFGVAGVVLALYKFTGFRVSARFTRIVSIATAGFAVTMLINLVLALFHVDTGLRAGLTGPVGLLAIAVSAIGCILAALNLVMDFDSIERGIRNGAPARQSWTAAFGLTVTMVWLYTENLRILSYFRR